MCDRSGEGKRGSGNRVRRGSGQVIRHDEGMEEGVCCSVLQGVVLQYVAVCLAAVCFGELQHDEVEKEWITAHLDKSIVLYDEHQFSFL